MNVNSWLLLGVGLLSLSPVVHGTATVSGALVTIFSVLDDGLGNGTIYNNFSVGGNLNAPIITSLSNSISVLQQNVTSLAASAGSSGSSGYTLPSNLNATTLSLGSGYTSASYNTVGGKQVLALLNGIEPFTTSASTQYGLGVSTSSVEVYTPSNFNVWQSNSGSSAPVFSVGGVSNGAGTNYQVNTQYNTLDNGAGSASVNQNLNIGGQVAVASGHILSSTTTSGAPMIFDAYVGANTGTYNAWYWRPQTAAASTASTTNAMTLDMSGNLAASGNIKATGSIATGSVFLANAGAAGLSKTSVATAMVCTASLQLLIAGATYNLPVGCPSGTTIYMLVVPSALTTSGSASTSSYAATLANTAPGFLFGGYQLSGSTITQVASYQGSTSGSTMYTTSLPIGLRTAVFTAFTIGSSNTATTGWWVN